MTLASLHSALMSLVLCTGVSACAVARPPDNSCPALPIGGLQTTAATQSAPPDAVEAMIDAIAPAASPRAPADLEAQTVEMAETAMMAQARGQSRARPITVRIITLSAGGQWGAFGAGLMAGWSQNPATPRPVFDVVTGVSAGAIIAVPLFAGPEFDGVLHFYRGVDADSVSTRRSLPALLRAPSINDPAPLEAFFRRSVTPDMVRAIARRHSEGDQLLISATNLDTTAGEIFDLGAVAEMADAAQAADCIVEAMLASAAIPGLLPPRVINGTLYADGGLRDQVFFRAIDTARTRVARDLGRPVRVEAYLVVNGALTPPTRPVEDRLLSYFGRSVEALADEVQRDSITDAVNFAQGREGWTIRGMVPVVDLSGCGFDDAPTSTFDPCLTRTVFDAGVAAGRATPIDWMTAAELRAIADEL
ncbi:patatin-like phospholipase family protein [Jannaschia pohangensis]|uniref:Predicted acylesterase/phospholipase RssA, contains patatin domain n=1 Tax=Jannaschia pohangensis TaxID=390807 RepID=A0A1I3NPZ6_9RHOB|nr:patatin-like phospholipase family protein [Jannaschia pohangensis]SFJ11361.1 Predicted acylesterase/phospholipase RssA, contains patatin domain [Jannaschia pohangensis]